MTPSKPKPSAGTTIIAAMKAMPWWQRIIVKTIGVALLVGPAAIGMKIAPNLISEGTSSTLALVVLGFLTLLMFVGLMITVPRVGVFVKEPALSLLPAKWRKPGG